MGFNKIFCYEHAKCFAYDGKYVHWTDSQEMLKAFVKHAIKQTGVWLSPGGRYKKFTNHNNDLILSWNYDQGTLSFQGKTGDCLRELFIDICTRKKSPPLNTCSLGLDKVSVNVQNTNTKNEQKHCNNDRPNSKSLNFDSPTLEELQNFIDQLFQCTNY